MKKDNKKALYESIMTSVAREVKKTLNEADNSYEKQMDYTLSIIKGIIENCYTEIKYGHRDRIKEKLESIKNKYLSDDILNMFPDREY